MGAALAVLVFAIGKAFLPGSPAFATLVIWICSVVGAEIAHWVSSSSSAVHPADAAVHIAAVQPVQQYSQPLLQQLAVF